MTALPDDLRALREALDELRMSSMMLGGISTDAEWSGERSRHRAQIAAAESRILSTVSALTAERDALQQQLHEGKTKNDQQLEPKPSRDASLFAARTFAAEVARVAHYLLNDKRWTRKSASQMLATIARKMNAHEPATRAWSEAEMRQLLGDAAHLGESHIVVVLHDGASVTELDSHAGASVLAVDPSRSSPTDETRTTYTAIPAGRSPEETP